MSSFDDRNKELVENFAHYLKLCNMSIKFIRKRYPYVSAQDLIEYAMVGALTALDRADMSNPSLDSYIMKYCFASAMEGARLMTGGHRVNKSGKINAETCFELILTDPMDLYQYIEEHQEIDWSSDFFFHDVDWKFDLDAFLNKIKGSYEELILKGLLRGAVIKELCKETRFDVRRVKRIVAKLCKVYLAYLNNKPFQQYLTIVPCKVRFVAKAKKKLSISKSMNWKKHRLKKLTLSERIRMLMKEKEFKIASHVLYSLVHKI